MEIGSEPFHRSTFLSFFPKARDYPKPLERPMKSVLMVTSLIPPNFSKYSCSSAMVVSQLKPPMNIFLVSSSSLVESMVSRAGKRTKTRYNPLSMYKQNGKGQFTCTLSLHFFLDQSQINTCQILLFQPALVPLACTSSFWPLPVNFGSYSLHFS